METPALTLADAWPYDRSQSPTKTCYSDAITGQGSIP